MKELLTKKYAGLPGWAWLIIGVAGVGAGIFLIRWQQSKSAAGTTAALTASTSPDLTTGNASGTETNSETGAIGQNGIINNPFPETSVNGQQVPIIPPGYQAVYDEQGNIIGFEPITTVPTSHPPTPPTSGPPASPVHPNGSTYTGSTGVLHYVAVGGESLSQIASKFRTGTWNSIYAIPDNQKLFGKLDAQQAAAYQPKAGQVITLPANAVTDSSSGNALSAVKRRAA